MKKVMIVIAAVLGILLAVIGVSWKLQDAASIGIIGGADGPTAVFVAGKIGEGFGIGVIALLFVAVVAGVIIYWKVRKQ